jgi:hypothetical protein
MTEPLYACFVCGLTRHKLGPCYCCRTLEGRYVNGTGAQDGRPQT